MLYDTPIIINPENRIIKSTGKEADDALEPLVGPGVPIAVCMRPRKDFLVDVVP
jgi:hypothetical protein